MLVKLPFRQKAADGRTSPEPAIVILPWGDVWDDFLDSIGISLETFCERGPGGWLLGYIESLRLVGVRSVVILVSTRVSEPTRWRHEATDATIIVLPATAGYRSIRRRAIQPNSYFAGDFEAMYGNVTGNRRYLLKFLNLLAPYLATPLGLLAREIRRENCGAILVQDYESPRFDVCTLLGKIMGLPVLGSFQSGDFDPNRLGRWSRPLTLRLCDGLFIGPNAEIERVTGRYRVNPEKIARIFNPIDLRLWTAIDRIAAREFFGLPEGARVVVWHGRVGMAAKRVDILLDAWEKICAEREGRDLRLFLLGTGQDAPELRRRIAAMPYANIHWIDRYTADRTEIRRFLAVGDVYAFPSVFEGFPVAPIEAMGCGLPLVAAAASGVPDILQDGEASGGYVVPRGDADAFAVALGRVLDDPEHGRELGKLARRRVETAFSLEAVGQQFRKFFEARSFALVRGIDKGDL